MPKKTLIAIISATLVVVSTLILLLTLKNCSRPEEQQVLINQYEGYEERVIKDGESLFAILLSYNIPNKNVILLTNAMAEHIDMSGFKPGQVLHLIVDSEAKMITDFYYTENEIVRHRLTLEGEKYNYQLLKEPYERKYTYIKATVTAGGTFLIALEKAGINKSVRQKIANVLESQISTGGVQPGAWIEVLLDDKIYKGKQLPYSEPIYVAFHGVSLKDSEAFWYDDGDATSAFNGMYNIKGEALASNAVRYPLNNIRVTSPFGKRLHPISGTWKMHNGIDYAGKTGTPVFSVTSGKVISAGVEGGYGKVVRIQHPGGMETQYAHLSKIYVKRGQAVTKGKTIGAVGSTGYSTGPHLHFGVKKNGRWVNPKTNLKMIGAYKLTGDKLKVFQQQQNTIKLQVEEAKKETELNQEKR
ncbi:MAG: M23 family metallopeptidase [Candidatus Cloacimonetes bacterium]|nr:M23 family metallopeptidase [Candidatus Cloacimonadota bacterium]